MDLYQAMENKRLVIPLLGAPGVRLSRTTLQENLTNIEAQYQTLYMLLERFRPDGFFAMMDLTVEVEALGVKLSYSENAYPLITEHPIQSIDDLNQLKSNWRGICGRMRVFIDLIRKLSQLKVIKGAYAIGPFTLAGELMGIDQLAVNLSEKPHLVHELIAFSAEVISQYVRALFEVGADLVMVLEPTAVLGTKEQYLTFSFKPFQKIVAAVKDKPLFLHICGDTNHLLEVMAETGADGLSLDSPINLKTVVNKIPKEIILLGNINPTQILQQAAPNEVTRETANLLAEMQNVPNFILSSGCDIPLDTPFENIRAFIEAAKSNYH